jgi:ferredoxin-type protein NapF
MTAAAVDYGSRLALVSAGCLEARGVACRGCESACEADAIRFRLVARGATRVLIDVQRCNGCGQCALHCPVAAIQLVSRPAPSMEKQP